MVKSAGCSCRDLQFGSQILLSNSKLTAILAPWVLIALFWYYLALNCVQAHNYTYFLKIKPNGKKIGVLEDSKIIASLSCKDRREEHKLLSDIFLNQTITENSTFEKKAFRTLF